MGIRQLQSVRGLRIGVGLVGLLVGTSIGLAQQVDTRSQPQQPQPPQPSKPNYPPVKPPPSGIGLGGVRMSFPKVWKTKTVGDVRREREEAKNPRPVPPRSPIVRPPGYPHWYPSPYRGVAVTGSGLSVNGSYEDDRWNVQLGLHLGAEPAIIRRGYRQSPVYACYPGYPYRVYPLGWYVWRGESYRPTIDGFYTEWPRDPQLSRAVFPLAQAAPTQPLTPHERGRDALLQGDDEGAVSAFSEAMQSQSASAEDLRWLALALLLKNDVQEGVAVLASAYSSDPQLASRVIDEGALRSPAEWRTLRTRVSRYANQINSSSSWLTLAVLMQSQGDEGVARTTLKKSIDAGLSKPVADAMVNAFKP